MKKKLLFISICLLAVFTVAAQDFTVDGVNYTITDATTNSVEVSSGSCYDGDLDLSGGVVYNNITYTVTSIGEEAFADDFGGEGCSTITSIVIPNSVTEISARAFLNCLNLTEVVIGNGLNAIYANAFAGVTSLASFSIDVATPINISARNVFTSVDLSTVTLNVPEGSEAAYASTAIWEDFSIYGGFTIDGVNYIVNDGSANTIVVGQGSDFNGDLVLSSTVMYNGVTYTLVGIKNNAFEGGDLTGIEIPDTVTFIEVEAFYNCKSLKNIKIGNGLETIEPSAFENVTALEIFSIDVVTPIALSSFQEVFNGVDVASVYLEVPEASKTAYMEATIWKDFSFEAPTVDYFTIDGVNYRIVNEEMSYVEVAELSCYSGDLVLEETIVYNSVSYTLVGLAKNAFGYYNDSTKRCDELTSIVIPDSVTYINESAFDSCQGLTEITIGNGLTTLGQYAFADTPLEKFSIDLDVPLAIGFADTTFGSTDLTSVELIVPDGADTAYSTAIIWKDFGTITVLSIEDVVLNSSNFTVYINSQKQLVVNTDYSVNNVTVFDITGRKMVSVATNEVNIDTLPLGLYIVYIKTKSGIASKKILKK